MAVKKSTQNCFNNTDCGPGYYCASNSTCVALSKKPGTFSGPSVKVAGSIIGAGLAGMGTYLAKTRDKSNTKKAMNKKIDDTLKKVTSKVMKKGGMVKKRVATKKK